jgi:hypothetical protein
MRHFWSICKGKGHVAMNGFNMIGLGCELLGVIFIWIYARQTRGMPTQAIIARYRLTRWLHIGIRLIVLGFLIQLAGFFFG